MLRLLFSKKGNAVWISHLDTMRVFQRSFKRSGLLLTHTQGFNPRPSVSIALPLSVGVESQCELLDFQLDHQQISCDEIMERLNQHLIDGIRVLGVYEGGRKLKELSLLKCVISLEYDNGTPPNAVHEIRNLFNREMLVVDKKGKNGIVQQDIISLTKRLDVKNNENTVQLEAVICCQNPSLNASQITAAIEKYIPHVKSDFVQYRRIELYDQNEIVFR